MTAGVTPAPRDGAVLEVEDLRAGYGPYRALFGVGLTVGAGETVALLGPNGAGKSTVARVVSGLVRPSSGRVRVDGRDVTGAAPWRIARSGVAHLPEGRAVFASLSVEENLLLALGRMGTRADVVAALASVYERFGALAELRRRRAGSLSGGQQRLLSLAKVIAVAPRVLVADELSLGLAPSVVDDVYESLVALRGAGTALLVVEQQVERALALASRAVVLDHGTVAYDGPSSRAMEVVVRVFSAPGANGVSGVDVLGEGARSWVPARARSRAVAAPGEDPGRWRGRRGRRAPQGGWWPSRRGG